MSRSPKLQRLTAMAVPALLAANAMVLVVGFWPEDAKPAGTETVTYIQGADGTLRLVDPTTPEGWKAIADANERGETVVTVPEDEQPAELMQQSATSTTLAPGISVPDVDKLLGETESTVVDTLDKVGDTVDGLVRDVTGKVDDTAGTNVGDILNPEVDKATDTLTTTVSTVLRGVTSTTKPPATTTTSTTKAPVIAVPEPVAELVPDDASDDLPVELPNLDL